MIFVRTMVIVLGTFVTLAAYGQTKLVTFVEANGCKLLAAKSAVNRLKEIASQGSVTWDGNCKRGRIDGKGVLREEGTVVIGGKTRKYAYFLSGTAKNGIRSGQWRRETFDRFVDSSRFYTSSATINFVGGVAKGRPKLLAVSRIDQLTPGFRKLVIEAQRDATPDNKALLQAVASPPAGGQLPARVTASSQLEPYGPDGLLASTPPGWHSANPPRYPEWVMVDFQASRQIRSLGLLPQNGHPERAPKLIRVEVSADGNAWTSAAGSDNACLPNTADGWSNIDFPKPATGRYLKITILSNCGDPNLVTFRGLRFD